MDSALDGDGAMLGIVGPPGIGKSRLVAELLSLGAVRGFEVVSAFCEAHAREVPFYVAARLFREVTGIADLRDQPARERVRSQLPGAENEDLLLLDDLLAIGDPEVEPPAIGPDARRRRLAVLLNTAMRARDAPVMYVVEDAHWIDEASESLVAEVLSAVRGTRALVWSRIGPSTEADSPDRWRRALRSGRLTIRTPRR